MPKQHHLKQSDIFIGLFFFAVSLAIKLPYLGTFLTIDEPRWIRGAGQFLMALTSGNLPQTYWHFFPGITIIWGEALILWLQSLGSGMSLEAFVEVQMEYLALSVGAMRLAGVVLTSLALPFVYAFARPLLGKWPAILGIGLIAVDPFWVAHSRIVNGDALTGVLMIAAYLAFALLLMKPQVKWAVISGAFVGLSFLTKLPAQILVPLVVILAVIGYVRHRDWKFWLKALAVCGLVSAVVFVLLWPAMWVAPVETLTMMYEDTFEVGDIGGKDKVEFFMGQVRETQSFFFYLLALPFRLTPVNLIGAALTLGILATFYARSAPGSRNRPATDQNESDLAAVGGRPPSLSQSNGSTVVLAVALLWLFIIVTAILANISPKKADRYLMSVVLALDLLAGIGWVWLIGRISEWANERTLAPARSAGVANEQQTGDKRQRTNDKEQTTNEITHYAIRNTLHAPRPTFHASLITLLVAIQLIFTPLNYPYVLTYYNPLLGSYARAAELVPVGWGEGLEQAAEWINRQPDATSATVSPYYENVTNHYLSGRSLDWSKDGKKQLQADYVVFYIAQTQRKLPFPGLVDYFQTKAPVHLIKYDNTPYIWIYKREQPLQRLDGEAEIIGRAQIVGYDQSETSLQPGSSTNMTLYLLTHDQQLPPNEDFWVSLVDADGNRHSAWQSDSGNRWTPNAIVEWRGELSLPDDIPPGDYLLRVSLVDTNTNAEVTHFPFEEKVMSVELN